MSRSFLTGLHLAAFAYLLTSSIQPIVALCLFMDAAIGVLIVTDLIDCLPRKC